MVIPYNHNNIITGYNYTDGPFLIRCQINEKTLYWTVDDFHTVRAEDCNPEEAARFYIRPRSHPEHLNEFYVVYYDSENKKHGDPFVPHYLQRSVTIFDSGANQPLTFGHYSREKETPLALYKTDSALGGSTLSIPRTLRRNRQRELVSVSLSSWISEPEACVIQHVRQSFTAPFIVAVTVPIVPEQNQPDVQSEPAQQHEESHDQQETQEVQQEMQDTQEVQETQDAQGSISLPGEQEISEPTGPLVYPVTWMDSSDTRVGMIKSFEIVPIKNN